MGVTLNTGQLSDIITYSNGNIGIGGAANASYKLAVTGASLFSSTLTANGLVSTNAKLEVNDANGIPIRFQDISAAITGQTAGYIGMSTSAFSGNNGDLVLYPRTSATSRILLMGGNVGIGTSSPSQLLTLGGTASPQMSIVSSTTTGSSEIYFGDSAAVYRGAIIYDHTSDYMTLHTAAAERMRITSNGNLLINQTTNEDGKLQINGTDNNVISHFKSSSGRIQMYAYYGPYGGAIIQSLNGAGSAYLNLRIETSTMTVSGNQTVTGTKSFAIDHPLDNTKTLLHYSTESPKADLIYRGKISLINGKAEINIDISSKMTNGTFETLCRDVQCFTTNETGWDMVKGKVIGNVLTIESNNQNSTDEISWMVIGERYDESIKNSNMLDSDGDLIVEKQKEVTALENK